MQQPTEVNVLLSGGIDSTALVSFYLARDIAVKGIHFNYGQPCFRGEQRAVQQVSSYYKISTKTISLGFSIANNQGEYHCRNAILLLSAASISLAKPARFVIGIHANAPYYDCSKAFIENIQKLLDGYFNGSAQVETPFLEFTKKDIIELCKALNVPVNLTFSCERNSDIPCGKCLSCTDRRMLDNESKRSL